MSTWISKVSAAISDLSQSPGPSRAQTLPVGSASDPAGKKKGFFTMKKK